MLPYGISISNQRGILFSVLCTSPNKFTVIDPEGVIAPQSCIDIVVRYTQPSVSHCNTTEKFRITMYDRNTQQVNFYIFLCIILKYVNNNLIPTYNHFVSQSCYCNLLLRYNM